jgi:hypothetical protein
MHEYPAGADQVLVVYLTNDDRGTERRGLTDELMQTVADDASRRSSAGFRIVSYDTLVTSGKGTSGGVVFNTGDEHPLDLAVTVVYARSPRDG